MKTVYVGLSGGVDSAVAAYLLKQEGHQVIGAFIKGWEPDFLPCTGAEDRLSAMRVAAHLGIPFVTVDLAAEYKRLVVDSFVAEYKAGRTPNPDVMCNRTIKFGTFWEHVKELGADCIATGHYAQTDSERLLVSNDPEKDQTYFLWTLTKADLNHTLFPIGALKKEKVRKIAVKVSLPNAARRDSQGLCFLGHVDMHSFLSRFIPPKRGDVIDDTTGQKVGEHDGAWFYTLGQHVPVLGKSRMFVTKKDMHTNALSVSETSQSVTPCKSYELSQVSCVDGTMPTGTFSAQYRYHGPFISVTITRDTITFSEPVLVASGQSVVLYSTDAMVCLGGGIIGECQK